MVSIEFDEETNILKLNYSNSVDKADIEQFIQYIGNSYSLPKDLKIYHRAAGLGSTMKMKDLMRFSKEMKQGTGKYDTVRAAVYTTNSLALTLSKMYEKLNVDSNTKYKKLNSERAAISWLIDL
jgi:hypothetical protein